MTQADEGQGGEQAAGFDIGIALDRQLDLGGNDIEPLIAYQHFGAAFAIGGSADLVRCSPLIAHQPDASHGLTVHQHTHRQRFARANLQGIDLRHDHHFQLPELR